MALAFITLFGGFISSILYFSSTALRIGSRSPATAGNQAEQVSSVAGVAIDASISRYQTDGTCLPRPSLLGVELGISCIVVPPEDPAPPGGTDLGTKPRRALLTLGTGSDDGISHTTGPLVIQGGIFSSSTIASGLAATTEMTVDGTVTATGNCTGRIVSAFPPLICTNRSGAAQFDPEDGRDPLYSAELPATVPDPAPLPDLTQCPPEVTLQPGSYFDAVALSAITDGTSGCPNLTVQLIPGTYYFDFNRDPATASPCVGSDCTTWNIGTKPGNPVNKVTVQGGSSSAGVQLVFGGESRIDLLRDGQMNLFASPGTASTQEIAVYGLKTTTVPGGQTSTVQPTSVEDLSLTGPGLTPYDDPTKAEIIGEAETANAALDATSSPATASLVFAGFDAPPNAVVPPGSVIHAVTLRVDHSETPGVTLRATVRSTFVSPDVLIDMDPSRSCDRSRSVCTHMALAADRVDLKALGFDTPDKLAGLRMQWDASLATGTGTESVDGAAVEIMFTPPSVLQPQSFTTWNATVAPTVTESTTLAYPPFDAAGSSIVRSLTLRARHHEVGAPQVRATVSASGIPLTTTDFTATNCDPSLPCPSVEESVTLPLGPGVHPSNLGNLTVSWSATNQGTDPVDVALDGVDVDVTYEPPTYAAESGCVTISGSNGCPLLKAQAGSALQVHGTVYAPRALIDVSQTDVTEPVFRRGIISRAVKLDLTSAPSYAGKPTVEIPGHARTVTFTAYVNARTQVLAPVGAAVTTPSNPFAPLSYATDIDGQTADAAVSAAGPAGLTLSGFEVPPGSEPIPSFSSIDAAILRVKHRETGDPATISVVLHPGAGPSIAIQSGDPNACDPAMDLCSHDTLSEDRIDVKSLGLTNWDQLGGLSVDYVVDKAAGSTSTTASIDGIALEVLYTPPTEFQAWSESLDGFSDPTGKSALAIDDTVASATLIPGVRPVASITLADYRGLNLPSGAQVKAVTLRVKHDEGTSIASVRATVSSATVPPTDLPLGLRSSSTEDRVDLYSLGFDGPATLAGLTVTWQADLVTGASQPDTANLDGIEIEVTYTAPVLEAKVEFTTTNTIVSWTPLP